MQEKPHKIEEKSILQKLKKAFYIPPNVNFITDWISCSKGLYKLHHRKMVGLFFFGGKIPDDKCLPLVLG